MPTYEYECKKCARQFEVVRSFKDEEGGICPTCGHVGQRIYAAPPLLFKGSGFYVTDSRKKSGQSEESSPSSGKSSEARKTDKSTEPNSKPKAGTDER